MMLPPPALSPKAVTWFLSPPKKMDVILDPFESKTLVVQAHIGNTTLSVERGTGLETKGAKSIINRNVDDLAI
jgi:hypothetical protein